MKNFYSISMWQEKDKIQEIKKKHQEVSELFKIMQDNNIAGSYVGPFDKYILISMAQSLKNKVTNSITQSKKFFKIFIELASNISYYSYEKENGQGSGIIMINEYDNYFTINAGNIINSKSKEHIQNKCELINQLNHDELRRLRRYLLHLPAYNENSGNVGLVQVALIAKSKLNYFFIPLDNENSKYFYIISVTLSKSLD